MKFIFKREDNGDYLYILTRINIIDENTSLTLNKYNPNEQSLIIELFNQFPKMPNYRLIYSRYSEPAQLQWIKSDYENQCYADAMMYTVFSVPLQSRLEFIFEELNGDLVMYRKRLMTYNILRFMLGVNNFISPDNARESFHFFLNELYKIDETFTQKDQNESDWLFLQHIIGLNLDNYSILTLYQEKVKNPEKNYLIKRLGPYTTSFELTTSKLYSMQSILTYTPGHFTSIIKTSSYGWIRYNDLSRQIEVLGDIKDYEEMKRVFRADNIDICNEYHITNRLFIAILDAHQEYWEKRNDINAAKHIERRIVTVVAITTDTTKRNLFNELASLNHDDYELKANIINEFKAFYNEMLKRVQTEKLILENINNIEMIDTFEKYHLQTNFDEVQKIFNEKVEALKQMCTKQETVRLIDKFVIEHKNTTADQLMEEVSKIQDAETLKFYPARFAIYDRIVKF
jgi:hypothetical protein